MGISECYWSSNELVAYIFYMLRLAMGMKSTHTTKVVSYVALAVFIIYALFFIGAPGFLFSIAMGLIMFSVVESVEIATALVILVGLLYNYWFGPKTTYRATTEKEGFTTAQEITERVTGFEKRSNNPKPTYSSPFVEGFADASSATNGQAQGEQNETAVHSATSQPAKVNATTATATAPKKAPLVQNFTGDTLQGASIQADGLFKMGELPTEVKGGGHIDQGTTLMNAIGSLQPDQIRSMTEDTRKLLDTQKSLMSMLNTMKPMLNDGKELMTTFQQMFGPGASASAGGAPMNPTAGVIG